MNVLGSLTAVLAFVGKELAETARRPTALLSLVVGPLLLIFAFGAGYQGRPALRTIVVVPPGSGLPAERAAYASDVYGVEIVDVVDDATIARDRVKDGSADLLVIAPEDLQERFRAGEKSVIRVEYDTVDPALVGHANLLARQVASEANRMLIERAVEEGDSYVLGDSAGPPIPPEVVAAPMEAEPHNLARTQPAIVSFYGPAALALILQHLAVTLLAMSLVRERVQGRLEIFRVAPVSALGVLIGKSLAYAALAGLVAATTLTMLVMAFGVPQLAQPATVAAIVALTIAASLALGAVLAGLSTSEQQAVQLSLFLLLASVFFSGFLIGTNEFSAAAQAFAFLLPVTHGVALLQAAMLGAGEVAAWHVASLSILTLGLGLVAWLLLRRSMLLA